MACDRCSLLYVYLMISCVRFTVLAHLNFLALAKSSNLMDSVESLSCVVQGCVCCSKLCIILRSSNSRIFTLQVNAQNLMPRGDDYIDCIRLHSMSVHFSFCLSSWFIHLFCDGTQDARCTRYISAGHKLCCWLACLPLKPLWIM